MDETTVKTLTDILASLKDIDEKFTSFATVPYSPFSDGNVVKAIDGLSQNLQPLQAAKIASESDSDTIAQIAQLLAYQELMLVVLTVVVVIFLGVFCGSIVLKWMRNR